MLLRTAAKAPNLPPSKVSASLDANYIETLITHSQACQIYRAPNLGSLGSPLLEPVQTSGYGWRRHPIWGDLSIHRGVDFIGPNRTSGGAALAVKSGVVTAVADLTAYGTTVIVEQPTDLRLLTGRLVNRSVAFLERTKRPAFVYFAFGHVHTATPNIANATLESPMSEPPREMRSA